MDYKLQEVNQWIEALQHQVVDRNDQVGFHIDPPFDDRIMQKPLFDNFKMSQLENYDGSIDPMDHLESFKALMLPHEASDVILYRTFLSTLKKVAQDSYIGLKLGSIHSFNQISRSFVTHFMTSKRQHRQNGSLMNIKQREGEHLHNYMNRFNATTLEVYDLDQSVTMTAFNGGLQKNFFCSLEKKYLKDFMEMLDRVEKYAQADKAFEKHDTLVDPMIREKGKFQVLLNSRGPLRDQQWFRTPPRCQ
ncbi:uncharacterized protein [Elaeis guineensis]|uniref:uncharacterized protein n=1 Tax=Elaeis guineensis var. tenera TaxID=51953 RepID=UPI003C6CE745